MKAITFTIERCEAIAPGNKKPFLVRLDQMVGGKLSLIAIGSTLAAIGAEDKLHSQVILKSSSIPAVKALGASDENTVFFEEIYQGQLYKASGVLIRGLVNDWVLVPEHLVGLGGGSYVAPQAMIFGTGDNRLTDRGLTTNGDLLIPFALPGISSDVIAIRLTDRISSPGLQFRVGVPRQFGDILAVSGFPDTGKALDTGNFDPQGNVMGITAKFVDNISPGYSNEYYSQCLFDVNQPISTNGKATPGFSGGDVSYLDVGGVKWNQGMATAASNGDFGYTIYTDFTQPDVKSWIENTTQPMPVPEPSGSLLVAFGLSVFLSKRNRRKG